MILETLQLSNQHVFPSKMGPPVSSDPTKRAPSLSILLSVIDSSTALSSRRRGKAESKSPLDRVEIASTTNYGWSTTPPGNTNTHAFISGKLPDGPEPWIGGRRRYHTTPVLCWAVVQHFRETIASTIAVLNWSDPEGAADFRLWSTVGREGGAGSM